LFNDDEVSGMIRGVNKRDREEWIRMRHLLWPEEIEIAESADEIYAGRSMVKQVFVHARDDGRLGGFIEIGVRVYAEGCETSPVAFIEGWYVDADLRRSGVGAGLVKAAEGWAREQGYREMGSDLLIDNDTSLKAHLALGFHEVERLIAMAKRL
jgi:aminoglycoside 6'-N-acetyltransferase I